MGGRGLGKFTNGESEIAKGGAVGNLLPFLQGLILVFRVHFVTRLASVPPLAASRCPRNAAR
jgi:hypothetical protein